MNILEFIGAVALTFGFLWLLLNIISAILYIRGMNKK